MAKCIDCGKETNNKPIFGELLCDECIADTMKHIEKNVRKPRYYDGEIK